ncbi:MAG: hypothetical protein ACRERD_05230, partial [Candidatus Binatia bacterium]
MRTTPGMSTTMRAGLLILVLLLWANQHPEVAGQERDGTLRGEFAVTIAAEDVPPDLIDGASLIGRWHITFHADGTYQLGRQDVGPVASGQFESGGGRLTLRAETGVLACTPDEEDDAPASYEWAVTDGQLQLVAIEEPCDRRRLLFTTRTLSSFAACPPLTPAHATPAAGTPVANPGTPAREGDVVATPRAQAPLDAAIDTVLRQMSDCWATRQPDHFLQLLSEDFRATQRPEGED